MKQLGFTQHRPKLIRHELLHHGPKVMMFVVMHHAPKLMRKEY